MRLGLLVLLGQAKRTKNKSTQERWIYRKGIDAAVEINLVLISLDSSRANPFS
jgi:hypothetical protein